MRRPLDSARWRELEPLLDQALDLEPDRRRAFLEELGAQDAEARADVERLLEASASRDVDRLQETAQEFLGAAMTSAPPVHIGRYAIERLLGRGGMGEVYLALDPTLNRRVALKILAPDSGPATNEVGDLLAEARRASSLDHPNIGTVFDAGRTESGVPFIAMAYYEGRTLAELLDDGPAPEEVLDWACQAARGLSEVHRHGLTHRDIKPSNLIVTDRGLLKIIDFGIAVTDAEAESAPRAGTSSYLSPEQAAGGDLDHRTDLWSLGAVLFELLTGAPPLQDDQPSRRLLRIQQEAVPSVRSLVPELPAELATAVDRCLERDRDERFSTADELLDVLEKAAVPAARGQGARAISRVVAAVALVAAGVGVFRVTTVPRGALVSTVAVFPMVPTEPDSALARLGRHLAVTVAASLDGLGDLRFIEPSAVLARTPPAGGDDLERQAEAARRLGAEAFVGGTVVPAGAGVRIDATVHDVNSLEVLGFASATGEPDDLQTLTDSLAFATLQPLWGRGDIPTPDLSAVTTRSLPALRAYLEGEEAFANAEWPAAIASFDRAIAADSTFYLAFWRSVYPRIYEGASSQNPLLEPALENRDRLPAPDRGLVELRFVDGLSARLEAAAQLTSRYPSYWPAWFEYGNRLTHAGPYVGRSVAAARVPMERVVELSPRFLPAREHLVWINLAVGDRSAALEQLDSLAAARSNVGRPDPLRPVYPLLREVLLSGGRVTARAVELGAAFVERHPVPEAAAVALLTYGLPASQLALADSLVLRGVPRATEVALTFGTAFAWAARGGWDAAFDATQRALELGGAELHAGWGLGLVAAAAVIGVVDVGVADSLARGLKAAIVSPDEALTAELDWIDGLLGFAAGDPTRLQAALERTQASSAPLAVDLAESLGALTKAADGSHTEAAVALRELENRHAEGGRYHEYGFTHPFFNAVNRLLAAQWFLDGGDPVGAEALLRWEEAVLWDIHGPMGGTNKIFSPLATRLRAIAAEALERPVEAEREFGRFLAMYDRSDPWGQALAADARSRLALLAR